MVCPNGDKNFNKILNTLFGNSSAVLREKTYYSICIFVRLVLFTFVLYFKDSKIMQIIVAFVSFFAFILLLPSFYTDTGNHWWSKKFQCVMALLVFISSLYVYFANKYQCLPPILLYFSLIGGITQSLFIKFC